MPAALCTCSKLRQLTRKVTGIYDRHLAPNAISIGQYALLAKIGRSGPIGIIPLADLMGMERSTLSRTLKPLIAAGWIQTLDLPLGKQHSKRSFGVQLTEQGRQKRAECHPNWLKAQAHINALLGQQQHQQLVDMLSQASEALENEEASA